MRRATTILTIVLLGLTGLTAQAGKPTAVGKLVADLRKQQTAAEKRLVQMWLQDRRGQEMVDLLGDYVARDVRLSAMDPDYTQASLLASVDVGQAKAPTDVARLVVLEHFRRKGLDVASKTFVQGEYMIRKGDLTQPPQEEPPAPKKRRFPWFRRKSAAAQAPQAAGLVAGVSEAR